MLQKKGQFRLNSPLDAENLDIEDYSPTGRDADLEPREKAERLLESTLHFIVMDSYVGEEVGRELGFSVSMAPMY